MGSYWPSAFIGLHIAQVVSRTSNSQYYESLIRAADFLSRQIGGKDLGWGNSENAPPDADSTANALIFLSSLNIDINRLKALDKFDEWHLGNGFYSTYSKNQGFSQYDGFDKFASCVTATVHQAYLALSPLRALGQPLTTYIDWMSNQKIDVITRSIWWETPLYPLYCVLRLCQSIQMIPESLKVNATKYLLDTQNPDGSWSQRYSITGVPFCTALGGICSIYLGLAEQARLASKWLLLTQSKDGSWPRFPVLHVPAHNIRFPDNIGINTLVEDHNSTFSTTLSILMLHKFLFLYGNMAAEADFCHYYSSKQLSFNLSCRLGSFRKINIYGSEFLVSPEEVLLLELFSSSSSIGPSELDLASIIDTNSRNSFCLAGLLDNLTLMN